ncbi:MAG: hypothetical protein KDA44_12950 [Planctomycetales bacterium]|nr:hypothetical protein [Planctomycetales bacterium]
MFAVEMIWQLARLQQFAAALRALFCDDVMRIERRRNWRLRVETKAMRNALGIEKVRLGPALIELRLP